ncbi:unnamed protein product [Medioppia subpectinata]|uniref:Uncharacterized protein n=1 Tax=Medioppia subpectinata TaxID=1979941 RepID=A0A7R9PTE5_9ACAR|nr:unnamed protein product [Medioppia subpectinata]CAG2100549.1 unnamed protein product [Medioppia subpectinata]
MIIGEYFPSSELISIQYFSLIQAFIRFNIDLKALLIQCRVDEMTEATNLMLTSRPKLGEKCIHRNASALDTLLPCGQHQVCSPAYGVCQCQPKYRPEKRKCVAEEPDLEASGGAQPLVTHSSHSHHSPRPTPSPPPPPPPPPPIHNGEPNGGGVQVLPTMTDDEGANKPAPTKTAGGSKALVIFLLIVAILLCIALAVVIIWRLANSVVDKLTAVIGVVTSQQSLLLWTQMDQKIPVMREDMPWDVNI